MSNDTTNNRSHLVVRKTGPYTVDVTVDVKVTKRNQTSHSRPATRVIRAYAAPANMASILSMPNKSSKDKKSA